MHPALQELIANKLAHTRAPQWEMPIADVRAGFRALWTPAITGTPAAVRSVADIEIPGPGGRIPARSYVPLHDGTPPLMVYLHGGGYVKGGIEETDAFCRNLAAITRHVVLNVGYRLAPEHPFPAALDDAYAATAWACANAAAQHAAPGPIVICGESAGGNLAAVVCQGARGDPRIAIRHQVLLQPVVDFTLSFPSIAMAETDCLVPRADLAWYYATYCPAPKYAKDPRMSPLFATDLAGLPPALIITAECDTLRDEAAAYAGRLAAAQVDTHYVCYAGMVHGFLQMPALVPDAIAAIEEIARAVAPPAR
jgi:acetyl esterase